MLIDFSEIQNIIGLDIGCFSCWWPLLGARKSALKKLKKQFFFQNKLYSFKARAHYFADLTHLTIWRAAKLGIFTHFTFTKLPQCNQSINSLIYVYSVQIPSCFLWVWVLNDSHGRTSSYYWHPKSFSVLSPV